LTLALNISADFLRNVNDIFKQLIVVEKSKCEDHQNQKKRTVWLFDKTNGFFINLLTLSILFFGVLRIQDF
jgi:hypothetical protein